MPYNNNTITCEVIKDKTLLYLKNIHLDKSYSEVDF